MTSRSDRKQQTLRLPGEQRESLKRRADRAGKSAEQYIRDLLDEDERVWADAEQKAASRAKERARQEIGREAFQPGQPNPYSPATGVDHVGPSQTPIAPSEPLSVEQSAAQ